jgi:endonuclease/exonuclease/phosphatase family metal-dependent hydrolase
MPASAREAGINTSRAIEHFKRVRPEGLPSSITRRVESAMSPDAFAPRTNTLRSRPIERARFEVPPSGLFGGLGLEEMGPDQAQSDPLKRVVPGIRGQRQFADIVSWNIEHLHSQSNWRKIPRIAELIRSFRCDFWGLQEVDTASLGELLTAINSGGSVRYAVLASEGQGQQSGALYRTDTTRVRALTIDAETRKLFSGERKVGSTGDTVVSRDVFHRMPLLLDVSVNQNSQRFDFRCAVVHLKSTDSKLDDKGNSLRSAAAEALAKWIERDRERSGEHDYLILGDMNAEEEEQGLRPFLADDLSLLSVGMQEAYGKEQALTRVASGRLLDHIVITADSKALMPEVDIGEQLIIRSDQRISDWTKEFSDHVPVAVRFVIRKDRD